MFDGIGRGRPFTLHPDTEANQILMMWNKQQRQKQKIQEYLKESSKDKTIEEIEERLIEILNEVEGNK